MSDIAGKMAEWRKTLWGTGPCPDSSQNNFTLTAAEREAIEAAIDRFRDWVNGTDDEEREVALRSLLERLK